MCPGQEKVTMNIAGFIEGEPESYLIMDDLFGICLFCGFTRNSTMLLEEQKHTYRNVRLHTLCQGSPHVEVEYCICPEFNRLVHLTGACYAIFPCVVTLCIEQSCFTSGCKTSAGLGTNFVWFTNRITSPLHLPQRLQDLMRIS